MGFSRKSRPPLFSPDCTYTCLPLQRFDRRPATYPHIFEDRDAPDESASDTLSSCPDTFSPSSPSSDPPTQSTSLRTAPDAIHVRGCLWPRLPVRVGNRAFGRRRHGLGSGGLNM